MPMPPATREEVAELIVEADPTYIERVVDTGASVEEIAEAIDDLAGQFAEQRHVPSTVRVAEVRQVLEDLRAGDNREAHTFSMYGESLVRRT